MKAYELGQFLTEPQARCSSLQAINSREKLSNIFTHWSIFGLFLGAGSPRANVMDPFMFDLEFLTPQRYFLYLTGPSFPFMTCTQLRPTTRHSKEAKVIIVIL